MTTSKKIKTCVINKIAPPHPLTPPPPDLTPTFLSLPLSPPVLSPPPLLLSADLSLLSRIPGRPYKEPAEIKVERDDSLDRDGKESNSKQSSEKSSKAKRKHKVRSSCCWENTP